MNWPYRVKVARASWPGKFSLFSAQEQVLNGAHLPIAWSLSSDRNQGFLITIPPTINGLDPIEGSTKIVRLEKGSPSCHWLPFIFAPRLMHRAGPKRVLVRGDTRYCCQRLDGAGGPGDMWAWWIADEWGTHSVIQEGADWVEGYIRACFSNSACWLSFFSMPTFCSYSIQVFLPWKPIYDILWHWW